MAGRLGGWVAGRLGGWAAGAPPPPPAPSPPLTGTRPKMSYGARQRANPRNGKQWSQKHCFLFFLSTIFGSVGYECTNRGHHFVKQRGLSDDFSCAQNRRVLHESLFCKFICCAITARLPLSLSFLSDPDFNSEEISPTDLDE